MLAQFGRNDEALPEFRQSIHLDSQYEDAFRNAGFLEWNARSLETAQADLQQALELKPKDEYARYYLGRVRLEKGDIAEALRDLEQSESIWPNDPDFLIDVAYAYAQVGRIKDAGDILQRLPKISLTDRQRVRLAAVYLMTCKSDMAIQSLEEINRKGNPPAKNWVKFDLALAELQARSYAMAEEAGQQYLGHLPENAVAQTKADTDTLIGIAEARAGKGSDAVVTLGAAARLAPNQEELWLNLTLELMQLSRYDDAISAARGRFDRAAKILRSPSPAGRHPHGGRALSRGGKIISRAHGCWGSLGHKLCWLGTGPVADWARGGSRVHVIGRGKENRAGLSTRLLPRPGARPRRKARRSGHQIQSRSQDGSNQR